MGEMSPSDQLEQLNARADAAGEDPDLLSRWLGIAALLASATELNARQGGAWPALALVSADAAVEAVLGLIASTSANPPSERAGFDEVYSAAVGELLERKHPMPEGLRTRIQRCHRSRNLALHFGDAPAAQTVATAVRSAHELRALAVDALATLAAFREATPIQAVARMVGVESIAAALILAEAALERDDLSGAADYLAMALGESLGRASPALDTPFRRFPTFFPRVHMGYQAPKETKELAEVARVVEETLKGIEKRDDRQDAWILALGIGMQPGELARLRKMLGSSHGTREDGSPWVSRGDKVVLTKEGTEWALQTTADVIFRLSQSGGLNTKDGIERYDD